MERQRYYTTQPEQKPKPDRTGIILRQFLDNAQTLSDLLKPEGVTTRKKATIAVTNFSDTETTHMTKALLSGIATANERWDEKKRNGALVLLSFTLRNKVHPQTLADTYTHALSQVNENDNPIGPIKSLLEAGKLVANSISKDTKKLKKIKDAWESIGEQLKDEDSNKILSLQINDVLHYFTPAAHLAQLGELRRGQPLPTETKAKMSKTKGGNPEVDEQIIFLANQNCTRGEIAQETGMTPRQVTVALQRIRRKGIKIELQREGDKNKQHGIKQVQELRAKDMSLTEISEELGMPLETVRWYWKIVA